MQERRKYVRLNIPLEINYSIQGKGGQWRKTITKNISPNGARFSIEEALSKGAVLELKIKIPPEDKSIPVKAKIVWIEKDLGQEGNVYDTGLEFVQFSEEDKAAFFQYFYNLMYDQFKKFG